jgi:predicted DNA-binding ArsR family transcriptional regulator
MKRIEIGTVFVTANKKDWAKKHLLKNNLWLERARGYEPEHKYRVFFTLAQNLFMYDLVKLAKVVNVFSYHHMAFRTHNYYKIKFGTDSIRNVDVTVLKMCKKAGIKCVLKKDIKGIIDALISGEMLDKL